MTNKPKEEKMKNKTQKEREEKYTNKWYAKRDGYFCCEKEMKEIFTFYATIVGDTNKILYQCEKCKKIVVKEKQNY